MTERIAEIERELGELDTELAKTMARRQGLKAELDALRSGTAKVDLCDVPLTDAIVAVLRTAGDSLSPTEIRDRLSKEGRSVDPRKVTATLSYLRDRGRVQYPGRGQYFVAG